MNTTERDKLIDKVRKLLSLSGSSNEHEAALAAERAQEMLAKYNLTLAEVEQTRTNTEIKQTVTTGSAPWRIMLGDSIGKLYFCTYFFVDHSHPGTRKFKHRQHYYVGEPQNIMVALMMLEYVANAIIKASRKAHAAARVDFNVDSIPKFEGSFKNAATVRIGHRIRERIEAAKKGELKTSDGTTLPALRTMYEEAEEIQKEHLKKELGELRKKPMKMNARNDYAIAKGIEAADKIGLDPQINQKDKPKQID